MFDHTSRYYDLETTKHRMPDGREIAYKRRRLVPPGKTFRLLKEVTVTEGDRLDIITYNDLGDPEQFWQVCDANDTMNPSELTAEIGQTVRIPIPEA
ncbi:MAG: LysM domain-containing protein [Phormidesmis sp.]